MPKTDFTTNDIKSASELSGAEKVRAGSARGDALYAAARDRYDNKLPAADTAATPGDSRKEFVHRVLPQEMYLAAAHPPAAEYIFAGEFAIYVNAPRVLEITPKPCAADPFRAELTMRNDGKNERAFTCPQCGRKAMTAARFRGKWTAKCWHCKISKIRWLMLMLLNVSGCWTLPHDLAIDDGAMHIRAEVAKRTNWYIVHLQRPHPAPLVLEAPGMRNGQGKLLIPGAPVAQKPRAGYSPRLNMYQQACTEGYMNAICGAHVIMAGMTGTKNVEQTPVALARQLVEKGLDVGLEYARKIAADLIDSGAAAFANHRSVLGADARAMNYFKRYGGVTKRLRDLTSGLWHALPHTTGLQPAFNFNAKEYIPTAYRRRIWRGIMESLGAILTAKKSTPTNAGRGNYWRISFGFVSADTCRITPPATAPPA